ncbi:Na/Pi cotransporter family protein [Alkaliphilus peptidifermentans]|uniref:Phosphate:Na+ symporter n=1 Tax=Alkaliphilus peptidifermentans DSM 18978 TaxID=1120976 RepID=A0A1G5K7G4_9FIRM|nr:Na/Pi symporter [Alkaliphilus peptidifermentans]SCY96535.1 phosphate:Na+ symporter [Alkaliphilus peptidifermentans DSM 18978]
MTYIIYTSVTGLALFLLGMKFLTVGLKYLVSTQIKHKLKGMKINPLIGLLIGTITTLILQSSSGATIIMVGLVEAGILSIYQVTPMIMGANIGTTITAQLIAFNVGPLAPIILIIGIIFSIIKTPYSKFNLLGETMIGIGLLFIGINLLGQGLQPLQSILPFQNVISELGNKPVLGILMGFSTAAIIQSSSSGIAILQSMAIGNTISVSAAISILLGLNIGTCVTTLIASLHLGKAGKKTALVHLIFNTLGVILVYPFLQQLYNVAIFIAPYNPARQLAHCHTLFNVITTFFLLPFFPLIVKSVNFLIKES